MSAFLPMKQRKQVKLTKTNEKTISLECRGIKKMLNERIDNEFLFSDSYLQRVEEQYYSTLSQLRMIDWPDMD